MNEIWYIKSTDGTEKIIQEFKMDDGYHQLILTEDNELLEDDICFPF